MNKKLRDFYHELYKLINSKDSVFMEKAKEMISADPILTAQFKEMTAVPKAKKPKPVSVKKDSPKKRAPKKLFFLKVQQEITKGQQSATCESHYKIKYGSLEDTMIRIKVKSDAYDFQSYAVADIWKKEDLTWSRLCNIPYSAMATKPSLRYQPNLGLQHFFTDINSLLTKAEMILA